MKKTAVLVLVLVSLLSFNSCETTQTTGPSDPFARENREFLENKRVPELFKVLFTSEKYQVVQTRYENVIRRVEDKGGDRYMMSEVKKYDKIDEAREGVLKVWLYPDSGKIMKIRPQQPTYLIELDKLITEDLQRWNFEFPKNYISPTEFTIRYRINLRKKQSDEQIMKEIREKMLEEQ